MRADFSGKPHRTLWFYSGHIQVSYAVKVQGAHAELGHSVSFSSHFTWVQMRSRWTLAAFKPPARVLGSRSVLPMAAMTSHYPLGGLQRSGLFSYSSRGCWQSCTHLLASLGFWRSWLLSLCDPSCVSLQPLTLLSSLQPPGSSSIH